MSLLADAALEFQEERKRELRSRTGSFTRRKAAPFASSPDSETAGPRPDPQLPEEAPSGPAMNGAAKRIDETAGAEKPVTIRRVIASTLQDDAPAREWLVPGLIPAREITMLSGDGGTGKSLLALQLADAVADQGEWSGLIPSNGRVYYLSAEDDIDEIHRRLAAIRRRRGRPMAELTELEIFPLAGEDAVLAAPAGKDGATLAATPLYAALVREIEAGMPSLLVCDTLADTFGGDEIKRLHARQFIGLLRRLCLAHGVTVLLLAHPSLSGMNTGAGTSGSTAWNNSVRSRLYFRDEAGGDDEDSDLRVLETKKSNYGRRGQKIRLRYSDGVFVPVINGAAVRVGQDAADERVFLEMLAEFYRQGRPASSLKGRNYAPSAFADSPSAKGVPWKRLAAAIERLLSKSEIHEATEGPPSKRRQTLKSGPRPAAEEAK